MEVGGCSNGEKDKYWGNGKKKRYVTGGELGCSEGEGSGEVKEDVAVTGMACSRGEQGQGGVGVQGDGEGPEIKEDMDGNKIGFRGREGQG